MGALVRYAAAPALLLPLALPWLALVGVYAGAVIVSGMVGYAIDLLVVAAEVMRQHRGRIEVGAAWWCRQAYRAASGYSWWLLRLHHNAEALIEGVGTALAPAWEGLMERAPLLRRLLAPLAYAAHVGQQFAEGAFIFVHDEVVPVALDLAERLPLVEELLVRHAYRDHAA